MKPVILLVAGAAAFAQPYSVSTVAGGAPTPTPIAALKASLYPSGMVSDGQGNVYFISGLTTESALYKLDSGGTITRIAGTGHPYPPLDPPDGALASSGLINPRGLALDSAANVYISDLNRIRKITPDGRISTYAGNGSAYSGDGGQAVNAGFDNPAGLAFDGAGNLYVADSTRIRKVSAAGVVTTVGGNGQFGYSGDGGPATSASLSTAAVTLLTADAAGDVFFVAGPELRIRKISASGAISTYTGTGVQGVAGEGVQATQSPLVAAPRSLIADAAGNLLFAEAERIRQVTPAGVITTIAGQLNGGYAGDGGPATAALFANISGVTKDKTGAIYVADATYGAIRVISPQGIISSIAGDYYTSYSGDGGPALEAQFNQPGGVALDSLGNLYIADAANYSIRKMSPGGTLSAFAGMGFPGSAYDGQQAASTFFGLPSGILPLPDGSVLATDATNGIVWRITGEGVLQRFAGGSIRAHGGDGGPALNAGLIEPWALARDSQGNVYVCDYSDRRVRKIDSSGVITTVAGNGTASFFGDGGPAVNAGLNQPQSVAVDSGGNLYIADTGNGRVRKVTPNGIISTIAGNGAASLAPSASDGDGGPAAAAWLGAPYGVALDGSGALYIAATGTVRKMDTYGNIVTIAGSDSASAPASYQESEPATAPFQARGLALDPSGKIYVADAVDNTVRALTPNSALGVANAASNLATAIAPGEIVVLYGSNLGPDTIAVAALPPGSVFPTSLGGTSVSVNGTPAPLIYVSAAQVAAIVPYATEPGIAQVAVNYQNRTVMAEVVVHPAAPGIFTADSSGHGPAAAVNEDSTINTRTNPAHAGDIISLFLTGEGQTMPGGVDGMPGGLPLPSPILAVTATVNGQPAAVQYAGGAYGEVAGVMQVNVQIPGGTAAGDANVLVTVGTYSTQNAVTVAVK